MITESYADEMEQERCAIVCPRNWGKGDGSQHGIWLVPELNDMKKTLNFVLQSLVRHLPTQRHQPMRNSRPKLFRISHVSRRLELPGYAFRIIEDMEA